MDKSVWNPTSSISNSEFHASSPVKAAIYVLIFFSQQKWPKNSDRQRTKRLRNIWKNGWTHSNLCSIQELSQVTHVAGSSQLIYLPRRAFLMAMETWIKLPSSTASWSDSWRGANILKAINFLISRTMEMWQGLVWESVEVKTYWTRNVGE